ncbi:GrpB family protein [Roseisolibacter sp. H3M3-2]|uniref:GrpB family protein n=1 Tax=Roseisolibacter sp. H3M3-2 TaxID=3031323 RepID=UPI0023DA84D1|nr:GrpB family protein [Roseisolibacter sp. H3M3-2]MDF1504671.1 GrpB family protein [Roseisolibacter sp. H3M3-2]
MSALGLASGSVRLAAPDAGWAGAYADEAARIRAAVGGLPVAVEHVGSTAVPGLVAKPILDLLLGRPADVPGEAYVAPLAALGYVHRGPYGIPGREYFVRDDAAGLRTHHLHLVREGSALWRDHLAFRDALRADPALAAEYAALKRALAAAHAADREAYTDGKGAFVRRVLRLAGADPGA